MSAFGCLLSSLLSSKVSVMGSGQVHEEVKAKLNRMIIVPINFEV